MIRNFQRRATCSAPLFIIYYPTLHSWTSQWWAVNVPVAIEEVVAVEEVVVVAMEVHVIVIGQDAHDGVVGSRLRCWRWSRCHDRGGWWSRRWLELQLRCCWRSWLDPDWHAGNGQCVTIEVVGGQCVIIEVDMPCLTESRWVGESSWWVCNIPRDARASPSLTPLLPMTFKVGISSLCRVFCASSPGSSYTGLIAHCFQCSFGLTFAGTVVCRTRSLATLFAVFIHWPCHWPCGWWAVLIIVGFISAAWRTLPSHPHGLCYMSAHIPGRQGEGHAMWRNWSELYWVQSSEKIKYIKE